MNARLAESKLRSKKECFQFLKVDCETYLPDSSDCITTYFLKDLICNKKKRKFDKDKIQTVRHKSKRAP